MGAKERDTSVNPSEKTFDSDEGETVAAPRFDGNSVRRARPAVPVGAAPARRSWPLALVGICAAAALAGGLTGGLIANRFQDAAPVPTRATAGAAVSESAARPPATESGAATGGESQPPSAAGDASQAPADVSAGDAPAGERAGARGDLSEEAPAPAAGAEGPKAGGDDARRELRGALREWVAATNARDLARQMSFYGPEVGAFYLTRNASREDVRAEKARVFGRARTVEVSAGEPDISLSPDGRTATMRFRKKYVIEGGGEGRRGEVLQELRWRRTDRGWRIVGERDLRVID